jgi:hypothetical protein
VDHELGWFGEAKTDEPLAKLSRKMRTIGFNRMLMFGVLGVVQMFSCNEHLPDYHTPTPGLDVKVMVDPVIKSTIGYQRVSLVVTNLFDETLQGVAKIQGVCEFELEGTGRKKTMKFDKSNLMPASYDPTTDVLTVDAGAAIVLRYIWGLSDDSLKSMVPAFESLPEDLTCYPTFRGYRVSFEVNGFLTIFENRAQGIVHRQKINFCYNREPTSF